MEKQFFSFVWRHSKREQIFILVLTVVSFPLVYISLEIPKIIINDAISGRDFRIRPDHGLFDVSSGMTQFGTSRDDWGHWFGGNNSHPFWHFVLPDHYLRRNPDLVPPDPRHEISISPGNSKVYM